MTARSSLERADSTVMRMFQCDNDKLADPVQHGLSAQHFDSNYLLRNCS